MDKARYEQLTAYLLEVCWCGHTRDLHTLRRRPSDDCSVVGCPCAQYATQDTLDDA